MCNFREWWNLIEKNKQLKEKIEDKSTQLVCLVFNLWLTIFYLEITWKLDWWFES